MLPRWIAPLYDEPISIDHGRGSYVWDVEGNRYLDYFGGVLTTMIGHAVPEVVAAVQEQAAKTMHTSTLYLSEPMITLAEEIAAVSGIPDARVFFTASGTEANDTALLLATCYRRSNQILAMRNSYHGRSFSAMAITGQRSWSSSSYSGLNVNFVHGGYRLRSPFRDLDDDAYTQACTDDLVQVIDMTTAGDVAAMIAEPIQGVGGFAIPPDGFFGSMGKMLDEHDILFISDEVQTGWGRTGEHFWGYEAHGIVPDIMTFAKGVGNGVSLAGVMARADIMNTIQVLSFSTFGGNPMSAAGGLATLRYILEHDTRPMRWPWGDDWPPARVPGSRPPTGSPSCGARASCGPSRSCIPAASSPTRPGPPSWSRLPGPRSAHGQGRALRQRDPYRTHAERHRGRDRRRRRGARRRHCRLQLTTPRGDTMTTYIKGGTVITATGVHEADVLIDGETIVAVLTPGSEPAVPRKGRPVVDATGKYVIPGGLDCHTHMELPFGGTVSADDFETGTRAAAWGGTTTIIDFATSATARTCASASTPAWPRPRASAPSTTAST